MFKPKERNIFKYHNGEKVVGIDPFLVQKKMGLNEECDFETDFKLLELADKTSLEAFDRLVKAARVAFNIKDFSVDDNDAETGLMDLEVMELLVDFGNWVGELKKKQEQPPSNPNAGELTS